MCVYVAFNLRLEITCDYKSNGCNDVIKLDSLNTHLRECQYQPNKTIECPNGCEVIMQRSILSVSFPIAVCS